MLKFSLGLHNHKLRILANHLMIPYSHIVSFDLPAGYTCPGANICKTYANRLTGKIIDGKNSTVRCYAASMECRYKSTRLARWHNFTELMSSDDMKNAILTSIPKNVKIIRIHTSGDFFNKKYFMAWLHVAMERPDITIFGYTKILSYYLTSKLANNFKLIYSHGGRDDYLADILNVPQVYIVQSTDNPPAPIICNAQDEWEDFNYICNQKSFSILVHGTQKAKNKIKLTKGK